MATLDDAYQKLLASFDTPEYKKWYSIKQSIILIAKEHHFILVLVYNEDDGPLTLHTIQETLNIPKDIPIVVEINTNFIKGGNLRFLSQIPVTNWTPRPRCDYNDLCRCFLPNKKTFRLDTSLSRSVNLYTEAHYNTGACLVPIVLLEHTSTAHIFAQTFPENTGVPLVYGAWHNDICVLGYLLGIAGKYTIFIAHEGFQNLVHDDDDDDDEIWFYPNIIANHLLHNKTQISVCKAVLRDFHLDKDEEKRQQLLHWFMRLPDTPKARHIIRLLQSY